MVVAAPRRFAFGVERYHQLIEVGALAPDDKVELINGEIFHMAAMGNRHLLAVQDLATWLIPAIDRTRYVPRVQLPIVLDACSEPEPDLSVLRARADRYRSGKPTAADTVLVIEIGDSSIDFDRTVKLPMYAAAGIPEFWLVDLAADCVEIHTEPLPKGYRLCRTLRDGDLLVPPGGGAGLAVSELLAR
ncbi:hypothetical protein LBMAG53_00940 [Planctomycetota bacterium]|nr:hypothetical protein LBMAG53_00940 [Planctomycetota bacterium]